MAPQYFLVIYVSRWEWEERASLRGHKCQSLNKLTIKSMAGVLKSPEKYYLRLKLCLSDGCFYANPLYSRGSKTPH